jgi:hypothetical protein
MICDICKECADAQKLTIKDSEAVRFVCIKCLIGNEMFYEETHNE